MRDEVMKMSCMDCKVNTCNDKETPWPAFCPTENFKSEKYDEWMTLYENDENRKIMSIAAEVEFEGYCRWTRAEEIIEFAKRIGAKKIGIATCVGLINEASIFTKILRSHGFEVYGAACKVGATPKSHVGIDEKCFEVGVNMCNPIVQAKILNDEKTDINVVIGLCVGHDSLFYKYSEAVTTTLITKDRVTGHNPAAAIYNANSYCKRIWGDK